MDIETPIYIAACQIADSFALLEGLEIAHKSGKSFEPGNSTVKWLETDFLPNDTQNYGRSNSGPTVYSGIYQVSVYFRPALGMVQQYALANSIRDLYKKGTKLAGAIIEKEPSVSPPIFGSDRVLVNVTVRYRCMATRASV